MNPNKGKSSLLWTCIHYFLDSGINDFDEVKSTITKYQGYRYENLEGCIDNLVFAKDNVGKDWSLSE